MRVNPMRAIRNAVVFGTLTSALVFGSALAAGPEKVPNAASTLIWPAGQVCKFEVRWDIPAVGTTKIYPVDRNGDWLQRQAGRMLMTVSNASPGGKSIDLKGGMKLDFLFHADGSIDVNGSGSIVAAYFPADVGGPSMWLFRGRLHDVVTADFTAVSHSHTGQGDGSLRRLVLAIEDGTDRPPVMTIGGIGSSQIGG